MQSLVSSQNNFTAVRYTLATIVALCHLAELSQVRQFQFFYTYLSAPLAVHGFFVISGFLIYRSYERNPDWKEFLRKRFRRILPAYIAVICICALCLVSVSELTPADYFLNISWWQYILANLFTLNFLQPELPGIFQQNPIHAVNGSLWTIKIELSFYVLLPVLIYILNSINKKYTLYILLVMLSLSVAYTEFFTAMYQNTGNKLYLFLHRQLPGQLSFFIMGILFYKYFDYFLKYKHIIGVASLLLTAVYLIEGIGWLSVFSLPGVIMWLAFAISPVFSSLDKHDYSYGIYLWHFPLIQLFVAQHWFDNNPWLMFLVFIMIVIVVSGVSWYVLETRFTKKSNKIEAMVLS